MASGDGLVAPQLSADVTHDAVVVIPGVMGSGLIEGATDRPLWGLDDVRWYVQAWGTRGSSLKALRLTPSERDALDERREQAGYYRAHPLDPQLGRIRPNGVLRVAPAVAPVLGGFEPYRRMLNDIGPKVADPAAVLAFAYDWRLPVEYNACLLADAAARHLAAWRAHPAQDAARREAGTRRPARLVLIAHSMGGLLARCLGIIEPTPAEETAKLRVVEEIRATITLGTPFAGAAKAAVLLNSGRGAPVPLPNRRLRSLAATLPGVHDLLPSYPCVDETDTVRRLTPQDVHSLGGDRVLAERAFDLHTRLAQVPMVGHRAVIGCGQRTAQTLLLRDHGTRIEEAFHSFRFDAEGELVRHDDGIPVRVDRGGDGTVPRRSAETGTHQPTPVSQQHGALAKASEGVGFSCGVITEEEHLGPALGEGRVGLVVPDVVAAGAAWSLDVTGVDGPWTATCRVYDADTDGQVQQPELEWRDGGIGASVEACGPGVYRVEIDGGAGSPVTQLVMVMGSGDASGADDWSGSDDD